MVWQQLRHLDTVPLHREEELLVEAKAMRKEASRKDSAGTALLIKNAPQMRLLLLEGLQLSWRPS